MTSLSTIPETSATADRRAIVLYDGMCPLCQRSVKILKKLDWLKRIIYQDARDIEHLPQTTVPLDPSRLLEEMHLVTPNRQKVYSGFKAFRYIAARLPLLIPIVPFLYLPGVPWLGQKAYLSVARNRYNLVPCKDGVCTVPLPKAKPKSAPK